mmetsp:Transcript_16498/g.27043  ORF Transcript_16498/g.27043 Transcript_16498/m.27043 type:complete len:386 (-) Transcript_16498:646-1803(-)
MKYWYNNGRTVSAYGVIVGKSYDHPEALKVIVKKVAKGSDNLKWRRGPAETVEDALNSEVVVEWPSDFLEKLSSEEYTSIEMPSAIRNAVANRPATSDLMKGKHVVHKRKNINIEQENDSEAQTLSKGAPVILKIWTGRSNVVFGKGIMIEDVMGDICKVLVQSVKKDMPLVGNLLEMNPGMAKTRDLEHREVEWEKELIEVEDLKKKKKKRKEEEKEKKEQLLRDKGRSSDADGDESSEGEDRRRKKKDGEDRPGNEAEAESDKERKKRKRREKEEKKRRKKEKKEHKKADKHKKKEKDKGGGGGGQGGGGSGSGPIQLSKFMSGQYESGDEDKSDSSEDENARYNIITGKKIKLQLEKSADDKVRDVNRKELLQFLNSAYDDK